MASRFNTNSSVGSALTSPQLPSRGAPAPQEQMNLWQKFQKKLTDDPNFRMALMTTGLNMMRTPELGESGFDVFADASTQGVGMLDQLRQRDTATTRQEAKDALEERRTTAVETTAAAGTSRAATAAKTAKDSAAGVDARLKESKRQFDARLAAGDFGPSRYGGGGAGSTGPEREASIATEAFLASGYYPRTEQGKALAALRARGLVGKGLITPQDRFDFAQEIAKDIAVFNPDMSVEQVISRAQDLANGLASPFNEADPSTLPESPNEGRIVPHPVHGDGVIKKVGEDQYTITFPNGMQTVTEAQLSAILAEYGI